MVLLYICVNKKKLSRGKWNKKEVIYTCKNVSESVCLGCEGGI